MLDILKEVAERRIKTSADSTSVDKFIQLSSVFMDKAIDEMNSTISDEKNKIQKGFASSVFKLNVLDIEFEIYNREYRDDTNDADVELVIYEKLNVKKCGCKNA